MLKGIVTWAEIDLEAITFNLQAFKRHIGERVKLIAVVKANAYGHGAVPVARVALEAGAELLAVHRAIEGAELRRAELRQAGLQAPILILGYTPPDGAELVVRERLTPSLMSIEFARALSARAEALGASVPVHVKVDTGMSRYGLMPTEVVDFLRQLAHLPGIRLEGLFTHFATADWADLTHARGQLAVFDQVRQSAQAAGFAFPMVHAANSAATMALPEAHFDAVRPGIALYGMDPSSEWPPVFKIRPALALKSTVSRVRRLPAGAGVSYGRTYVTTKPTTAALVPVGYGDGYHRLLSNKSQVLIRGRRAPLIGRVCMDQFVVDVSGIPGAQQDDEVVLVGRQGDEQIRAEEVAGLAGTINYEVTTSLLPRVARVYLRGNEVVQIDSLAT
ncbi:MAG: alanine racemase [Chloroflexi bacterium RBG_16_57_11]|nr:MAG: alanine racemase [Chloroflexi bacterium RBG_16_57_11]